MLPYLVTTVTPKSGRLWRAIRKSRKVQYVTNGEIKAIQAMWSSVLQRLNTSHIEHWKPFEEFIRSWGWPGSIGVVVRRSTTQLMLRFARKLLRDLTRLARDRPAVLRRILHLARYLDARLPVQLDEEFAILYPELDSKEWLRDQPQQAEAARGLAARWAACDPTDIARRLTQWEAELMKVGDRVWPRWSPFVCQEISQRTSTPAAWFAALRGAGAAADLVAPFMRQTSDLSESEWVVRLTDCLNDEPLRGEAVAIVLTMTDPPKELLTLALDRLGGLASLVGLLCIRGAVPESTILLLLRHQDSEIAVQAALGEWHRGQAEGVRPTVWADWRDAILRSKDEFPEGVFRTDDTLAHDWFAARFADSEDFFWRARYITSAAFGALKAAQRRSLLTKVPATCWTDEVVRRLVGDDPTLYRHLLSEDRLQRHHLVPLRGRPEEAWIEKAVLALEAGYSPDEIAEVMPWGADGWSTHTASWWAEWMKHFEGLEGHPNPHIRRVGEAGRRNAKFEFERQRQRERREAVYGDN